MSNPILSAADPLNTEWLEKALTVASQSTALVLGDFCLDAYWEIDPDESEISIETGLPVRRIRHQRYSPGGAGNVAVNLQKLGVKEVRTVGILGQDMSGDQLNALLQAQGVRTEFFVKATAPWQTPMYAKPMLSGKEMSRMDFGAFNEISPALIDELITRLESALAGVDVVVINQQLPQGLFSEVLIERINAVIAAHPEVLFLVDSRHFADHFRGAVLKVNAHEAARLLEKQGKLSDIPQCATQLASLLSATTGKPVIVTRGEFGLAATEEGQAWLVPGIQVMGKTDPVGAGDTVVAAVAAVLGGGGSLPEAIQLANLAASITVRHIGGTGFATPEDLRLQGPRPDYVHEPELAENPLRARYAPGTEIEVVNELPATGVLRHAVFDHDGTLSTLRQGWEEIMLPMMMKAILGARISTVPGEIYQEVEQEARSFIDKTTGIQTLVQMQGLRDLVRDFGFVPAEEILDEHGYKALYNQALLEMVHARIRKIREGELDPSDFEIKGARIFLETLHRHGVILHLASGTDENDVKAEAEIMGYAHLFQGGIHGAVGNVAIEAKRAVLERILSAPEIVGHELLVIGDGPVEIREGRKRGAKTLGIASNEVSRHGLDLTKRKRLIRAGADIIIPDYSQQTKLLPLLAQLSPL